MSFAGHGVGWAGLQMFSVGMGWDRMGWAYVGLQVGCSWARLDMDWAGHAQGLYLLFMGWA
jgi:hypothetical protein